MPDQISARPAHHGEPSILRRVIPDVSELLHERALAHRLLAARGVRSRREFEAHSADLPGTASMPDIEPAVERLMVARERNEYLLVVGDYDCDGATSSALALLALQAMGFRRVGVIVPNRFHDGYGLSEGLLQRVSSGQGQVLSLPGTDLPEHGPHSAPDLILTVDNGIAALEAVDAARASGIDVVITDHHLPGQQLPAALAVVNPNRCDAQFESRALAGVGVLFYLLLALRAVYRTAADPAGQVKLGQWLDLVAIGTVADLVPLDAVNRILVEQGLRRIRAGSTRPGVLALLELARCDHRTLSAIDIGFAIGPRLNAAGRLADMRAGIECLVAPDKTSGMQAALRLDAMNSERRQIEARMRREADEQVASALAAVPPPENRFGLVLFDAGWHEGVIGILAGRLKDQQHRPVAVFAGGTEEPELLKGSVRSIPGVHVRDVLVRIDTLYPDMILRFGGHAMAAGLTIGRQDLDCFRAGFDAEVARRLGGRLPGREFTTDGALSLKDATLPVARLLRTLAPWGMQFEAPVFDGPVEVVEARVVGQQHLKLRVQWLDGQRRPVGPVIDAIAFRLGDEHHRALAAAGARLHIVYELSINRYRERESVQLIVRHLQAMVRP